MSDQELIEQEPDDGQLIANGVLPEGVEDDIRVYLTAELSSVIHDQERKELMERVSRWKRQREVRPEDPEKDFPWPGASNVEPVMMLTNSNAAYSIIKRALSAKKPFFSTDPSKKLAKIARAVENLMDVVVEGKEYMDIRRRNRDIAHNLSLIGTQFVRVPWIVDKWAYKRRDEATGELVHEQITRKDCPDLIPVEIGDLFTRTEWTDLQRAPWVAVRHWLMEHELKQRKSQGVYENVDDVIERGQQPLPEWRVEELEGAGLTMRSDIPEDLYDIYEVYLFHDIDGDGLDEDVKVWFDLWSGKILRWELNQYPKRDLYRLVFIERPGQLYGMGVGWILEGYQDAVYATMHMRLDGTKLSAFQMYVTSTSSNIGPNEEFFPLKNIRVNTPKEDFFAVKFPDIGPGTLQAEMILKEDASRAVGISEAQMGFSDQTIRTRATASGTMFKAQQNSALMDTILESIENTYSDIGQMILLHLVSHPDRTRVFAASLDDEDQELVEELLSMPKEQLMTNIKVNIKSTEQEKTEDARRQQMMTMVQLYTMYGQQVFQLLPMIFGQEAQVPPEIKEVAAQFYVGSTKMMQKLFTLLEQPDSDDYLPYVKHLDMMLDMLEGQKDQQLAAARQQQSGGGEING